MNDRKIVSGDPTRSGSFLKGAENPARTGFFPRSGETISQFCKPESAIRGRSENSLRFIDRFLMHSFLRVNAAEPEMNPVVSRVQLHRLLCLSQCSVVVPSIVHGAHYLGVVRQRQRVQSQGLVDFLQGLAMTFLRGQQSRIQTMRSGVTRIEGVCTLELALCLRPIAESHQRASQGSVGFCQRVVQFDRLTSG